ncbi:MAG TPA: oxygenase MpaB family protein [Mycobacteriales bacterium]|nr:oxygenase MpaB family protein [Mycobacteriales bacterium]
MDGYDGLFPPGSVTWRVHADPVMWVGGLRALLLQAVHPAAMAGVLEHSDFRSDPWGRLMRTANYVGTVSFGPRADVERLGARVRQLHARVEGRDRVSGRRYRASDPDLLRWVHCCEVDSFLSSYRRSGGRLDDRDADRYLAEQTRAAAVVGLELGEIPASVSALADYFAAMRPSLLADERVRATARFVLHPPMPSKLLPLRPAWAGIAALAWALLPPWVRRLYGLPGLGVVDLLATSQLRILAAGLRALPATVREGPHVRAARRRLAAAT